MPLTKRRIAAVTAATAVIATMGLAAPAYAVPVADTPEKIVKAVKISQVMNHLRQFQKIADANDGNRASGLPGYDASVDYIVKELTRAGYDPEVQEFPFTYTEENSALSRQDPATTWVDGQDFLRNGFDPSAPEGTATGALVPVDLVTPFPADGTSTSGCEADDFTGFPAGGVALVQRGTCDFVVKALNAQAAGAAAVIVTNDGRAGLVQMSGDATGLTIPAVFTSSAVGEDLAATPGATVTVTVDYFSEERATYNVFAETNTGDDGNVVMAGAHLDSVQAGAGINDNGSGSAALLETAIQMQRVDPTNTVRFAWWGAEEEGLLGADYYVSNLTPEQIDDIALYLNFDMIGSPNHVYGVYDGDNSSGTAPEGFIPAGSAQIEDVFEQFYASQGVPFQDTEFSGRSDYGPFIAVGIPAGGLFTGAEGIKTEEEAARFGGLAGVAYDPCYHQLCDNLTGEGQDEVLYKDLARSVKQRLTGNVNRTALDVNSDALASAIITFAFDTSILTADDGGAGAGAGGSSTPGGGFLHDHGHHTEAAAR
ncbi:Zn-dependent M28 family amino/carboxypeptidase [Microbacterium sp. SLBN-154]|uniref:M28 family metallopeptidase n=1 Tax=Microbacterium sp. SLBN-154 TaxID=2768458 RepID=UPI0011759E6C|nr:M28 family metallopeptidase [Microbacterium sp. SLBN-154]TQK18196.1 Zn-dependent M28 family amino/carboxypeptidase [Microbacterium sp. SLBN-154]